MVQTPTEAYAICTMIPHLRCEPLPLQLCSRARSARAAATATVAQHEVYTEHDSLSFSLDRWAGRTRSQSLLSPMRTM